MSYTVHIRMRQVRKNCIVHAYDKTYTMHIRMIHVRKDRILHACDHVMYKYTLYILATPYRMALDTIYCLSGTYSYL